MWICLYLFRDQFNQIRPSPATSRGETHGLKKTLQHSTVKAQAATGWHDVESFCYCATQPIRKEQLGGKLRSDWGNKVNWLKPVSEKHIGGWGQRCKMWCDSFTLLQQVTLWKNISCDMCLHLRYNSCYSLTHTSSCIPAPCSEIRTKTVRHSQLCSSWPPTGESWTE